jgi:hypothetical protein
MADIRNDAQRDHYLRIGRRLNTVLVADQREHADRDTLHDWHVGSTLALELAVAIGYLQIHGLEHGTRSERAVRLCRAINETCELFCADEG